MKYGITGSIGSGKSTVSKYLRDKGYHVFDCDTYNRELLEKGNLGYSIILDTFPEVFDGEELNKKKLSDLIFTDKEKKLQLENILHPLILDKMLDEASEFNPFFAEVPLLFETEFYKYFDYCLLIVSDNEKVLDRLKLRGVNNAEAKRRFNNQMSIEEKKKRSNGIIYNNSDLANLYNQVDNWLNNYVGE